MEAVLTLPTSEQQIFAVRLSEFEQSLDLEAPKRDARDIKRVSTNKSDGHEHRLRDIHPAALLSPMLNSKQKHIPAFGGQ